jgi:hypothetical protein
MQLQVRVSFLFFWNVSRFFYNIWLFLENEQEIGLKSLAELQRGSVLIEKNPNLCYVESIDWGRIGHSGRLNHFIQVIIKVVWIPSNRLCFSSFFYLEWKCACVTLFLCVRYRKHQNNRFFGLFVLLLFPKFSKIHFKWMRLRLLNAI